MLTDTQKAQLRGDYGTLAQISAFRDLWTRARLYVRVIRQSTLGCFGTSDDLEALTMIATEVDCWFELTNKDLEQIEQQQTATTAVH